MRAATRSPEPRGIRMRTGFLATSGTAHWSPPKTRASPIGSPAAKSSRGSKARKPQSSSLRDSLARSRPVLRPLTTTISRCPFCTAEPTRPKPDSSILPVFTPVGADVHGEQRVAVLLPDLVPGELALAEHLVEVGIGVDDVHGQAGEIARRDLLLRVMVAGRVAERRFGEAELAAPARSSCGRNSPRCRRCLPPPRWTRRCPIAR